MKLGDKVKVSWNGRIGTIVAVHGSIHPFHWMVELEKNQRRLNPEIHSKKLLFRGDELEVIGG
jgi:hypothetical protein